MFYINTHVHVLMSTHELLGVTCINKSIVLYCIVITVKKLTYSSQQKGFFASYGDEKTGLLNLN